MQSPPYKVSSFQCRSYKLTYVKNSWVEFLIFFCILFVVLLVLILFWGFLFISYTKYPSTQLVFHLQKKIKKAEVLHWEGGWALKRASPRKLSQHQAWQEFKPLTFCTISRLSCSLKRVLVRQNLGNSWFGN